MYNNFDEDGTYMNYSDPEVATKTDYNKDYSDDGYEVEDEYWCDEDGNVHSIFD